MASCSESDGTTAAAISPNVVEEEDEGFLHAFTLCTIQVLPAIMKAAIELNLFEIIDKETPKCSFMSASEIASKLPTTHHHPELPNRLDRMLRFMGSFSLLNCSTRNSEDGIIERVYGLSRVGKHFVPNENSGNVASMSTLYTHPATLQVMMNFKDAIIDVDSNLFKKVHGMHVYQYTSKDLTFNEIFNKSMRDRSTFEMNNILEVYRGFEGVSTLVDVGGGTGQSLHMIISKYPSIKGINFDLPQVIEIAPRYPGIQYVAGDMYVSVPQGDAIILKFILHSWQDEQCLSILKNCHNALPENGKVIAVEFIMPPQVSESYSSKVLSNFDNMMLLVAAGKERTEKEYEALCKLSGFSRFQVACRAFSTMGIMEFHK